MTSVDILNLIFNFVFKPALALSILMVFTQWSNFRSPHTCHWLLVTMAVVILMIMPAGLFVSWFLAPSVWSGFQVASVPYSLALILDDGLTQELWFGYSWGRSILYGVFFVYALTALTLMFLHAFDMYRAYRLVKRARLVNPDISQSIYLEKLNRISFYLSDDIESPAVWAGGPAKILLPREWLEWPKDKVERVIAHELAHIERHDWFINNGLTFICAVFWFLPPVWMIRRRVFCYAEYACDDAVVDRLDCRAEYAEDLMALSTQAKLNASFVGIASSELVSRVHLILEGARDRSVLSASKKWALLITGLILLVPLYASLISVSAEKMKPELDLLPLVSLSDGISRKSKMSDFERSDPFEEAKLERIKYQYAVSREEHVYLRETPPQIPELEANSTQVDSIKLELNKPRTSISMQSIGGQVPMSWNVPRYPRRALQLGIEAKIQVRFDINIHGEVENISFKDHRHAYLFRKEIIEALSHSVFKPVVINGEVVAIKDMNETFLFVIDESKT